MCDKKGYSYSFRITCDRNIVRLLKNREQRDTEMTNNMMNTSTPMVYSPGGFLYDFLVSALDGTFSLVQPQGVTVAIA